MLWLALCWIDDADPLEVSIVASLLDFHLLNYQTPASLFSADSQFSLNYVDPLGSSWFQYPYPNSHDLETLSRQQAETIV